MAYIVSIAHKTPAFAISQKHLAAHVAKASNLDAADARRLEKLYDQSGITTRYSVLEDFSLDVSNWSFWNKGSPTTKQRNELYKLHAPILSEMACKEALDKWGQDPKGITHIIYVSCTGIIAPGIQAYLQNALNLAQNVCQFGLNMMGCFGAFKALQMAEAFCAQSADARVLVVCTELCSLHFQQKASFETQIGNALFSDGSASCIVAQKPKDAENPLFCMHRHKSMILPNTSEKMTWEVSDNGLIFGIKKEIPDLIQQHIAKFANDLLPDDVNFDECTWPVHPGGKGVLQAVQHGLKLTQAHMQASWNVLKNYGNTSSSSFLFVLNEQLKHKSKKWAVGLGFGPGLCFEGMLLEIL